MALRSIIHGEVKKEPIGQNYNRDKFVSYLKSKEFQVLSVEKVDNHERFTITEIWHTGALEHRTLFVEVDENNKIHDVSLYHGFVNEKKKADQNTSLGIAVVIVIIVVIIFLISIMF